MLARLLLARLLLARLLLAAVLPAVLATGCATSVDPTDSLPPAAQPEAEKLLECDRPECTRLLACYIVLGYGELLYTQSKFPPREDPADKRGRFETAAERLRDWPEDSTWAPIDARYSTMAIALAIKEAAEDRIRDIILNGLSPRFLRQLFGRAAIKAAVVEAVIDAIKRQEKSGLTITERTDSCLSRVGVIEDRLKALSGV